jgi:hypothetical protein
MRQVDMIVVHCSDSRFGDVRKIREWHIERGWSDIGYHKVVLNGQRAPGQFDMTEVGLVEPGRPERRVGSHVRGHNSNSLGICYIGGPEHPPDNVVWDVLTEEVVKWCETYGLSSDVVFGHTELNPEKSCPNLDMDKFRADVQARLDGAY